jgi:hypothetical protein
MSPELTWLTKLTAVSGLVPAYYAGMLVHSAFSKLIWGLQSLVAESAYFRSFDNADWSGVKRYLQESSDLAASSDNLVLASIDDARKKLGRAGQLIIDILTIAHAVRLP